MPKSKKRKPRGPGDVNPRKEFRAVRKLKRQLKSMRSGGLTDYFEDKTQDGRDFKNPVSKRTSLKREIDNRTKRAEDQEDTEFSARLARRDHRAETKARKAKDKEFRRRRRKFLKREKKEKK